MVENFQTDLKLRLGIIATCGALLANELCFFIKEKGLDNPLATCLFKMLLYVFIICMTYSNSFSKSLDKIQNVLERILVEVNAQRGIPQRFRNYNQSFPSKEEVFSNHND